MKTSLEIDDQVYQAARTHALREHTTVRALVERGLRTVLGLREPSAGDDPGRSQAELVRLEALCGQVASLPRLTGETDEEILGYNESEAFP